MVIIDMFLYGVLFFMLLSLFNLIRYMLKVKKVIKMNKDNPNVKGISIVNGEIKVIENTPTVNNPQVVQEDMVMDETCGKKVAKKDAYRVFKDGKEYFFCSWECRDKFFAHTK